MQVDVHTTIKNKFTSMKKGILPLKLYSIIVVLGVAVISFSAFTGSPDSFPPQNQDQKNNHSTEHLIKIRNNQVTGLIEPSDIKLEQTELEKLASIRANNLDWKQIGPDNFGGSTRAIQFDNQGGESNLVYAGSATGGLWKSTNLGTTWQKINMSTYNLNVSSITQTSNGDFFVGTGEVFDVQDFTGLGQLGYTTGFMGQGIFKSTDGENFELIASTKPQFNDITSDWAFVNELANDQSSGRIYAATNTGLKYSNDGGTSWSTVKDIDGNELTMNSLDVKVGSDGNVVACINQSCYISTNGDVNAFVNRSTGDSVSLPASGGVGRIEFAIAPSDPNIVYASVAKTNGSVYNIYRSDDKGENWRVILPGTTSVPIFGTGNGIYDNTIVVFPDNPDRIIIGGIDAWQGQKFQDDGYFEFKTISESATLPLIPTFLPANHHTYAFVPGTNNKFFVGTDGGVFKGEFSSDSYSYETCNRNYFTTQFYTIANSGVKEYVVGGSQNNGTITMPGTGNTDGEGYQILTGSGGPCVVSSIIPNVIVVSSEDGVIRRSDDFGVNYSIADQFPGSIGNPNTFQTPMLLVENFNNPYSGDSIYYKATEDIQGGSTIRVRSHNAGQPFYFELPQDADLSIGDSIQVKDVVTAYYYIGVASGIFFTKDIHQFDKDPEWFTISNSDFGLSGTPYSMAMSSDGNHLYVGTDDGKLFRISNLASAYNFERADVTSPQCIVSTQQIPIYNTGTQDEISQVITSISVDPQDPNNVMITLGNYGNDQYIMYSSNALDQVPDFTSKQGNLPHMPVYSSIIEMNHQDIAIIGTEHGIFSTENIMSDSPQWSKQYTDMGSVPVFNLKQQLISQPSITIKLVNGNEVTYLTYPGTNNLGTIYAATFGRGVFMSDTYFIVGQDEFTDGEENSRGKLNIYPNPVTSNAYIEFNLKTKSDLSIIVYDLSGRMVKTVDQQGNKGLNKFALDFSNLSKGTYVISVVSGTQKYTSKFLVN